MKTSEDVQVAGLYVAECCDAEKMFNEGDTFQRCPQCSSLARWQLVDTELNDSAA